jgi:hypothetical protein
MAKCNATYEVDDMGELPVTLLLDADRSYEPADRGVGFSGGWFVSATILGAKIGELILSREDTGKAFDRDMKKWDRALSEDLTEGAEYDDKPCAPSRMEGAE